MTALLQRDPLAETTPLQRRVLGLIRRRGACSRRELCERFGWRLPQASKTLKPLLEADARPRPEDGRQTSYVRLNTNLLSAVGVSLGFSSVSLGVELAPPISSSGLAAPSVGMPPGSRQSAKTWR